MKHPWGFLVIWQYFIMSSPGNTFILFSLQDVWGKNRHIWDLSEYTASFSSNIACLRHEVSSKTFRTNNTTLTERYNYWLSGHYHRPVLHFRDWTVSPEIGTSSTNWAVVSETSLLREEVNNCINIGSSRTFRSYWKEGFCCYNKAFVTNVNVLKTMYTHDEEWSTTSGFPCPCINAKATTLAWNLRFTSHWL